MGQEALWDVYWQINGTSYIAQILATNSAEVRAKFREDGTGGGILSIRKHEGND